MPRPERRRFLKLVVASPGDVQPERKILCDVIENLNKSITSHLGLYVQVLTWETDAYPGFHLDGPQGLIDEVLGIDKCDIMVGIFWKRFGTPTKDSGSGTEHELRCGYEEWKASGGKRPHIMVYFKEKAYLPKSASETEQWAKVLEFKKQFPKEGLWWAYKDIHEFERLTWRHLTQFLVKNAGALGGSSYKVIKSADMLYDANARIVKEAQEILYMTGSRSRDEKYLKAIETKLCEVPQLVHYRVLFGQPHHQVLKDHLLRLLKIRSPADRSLGFKTIHLGLYESAMRQFEAFILGNEQEALVLLPSFSGVSEYNSAIIFTDAEEVEGLKRFVKELYAGGKNLETTAKVEALKVLRVEPGP
jgi:hypothetical protein